METMFENTRIIRFELARSRSREEDRREALKRRIDERAGSGPVTEETCAAGGPASRPEPASP
jgi:hypothetical protein